jgi:hypothetical protein
MARPKQPQPCGTEPGAGVAVMLRTWNGAVLQGQSSIGGTIVFNVAGWMLLPAHSDGAWAHASIPGGSGSIEVHPAPNPFASSIARAPTIEQLERFRERFGRTPAWETLRPRYEELVAADQERRAAQQEEHAAQEREEAVRTQAERADDARRDWQSLKRRQLPEVEAFVDRVGRDVAPTEALKVLDALQARRAKELARRYGFKGLTLGMTRREVERVRAIHGCETRVEGYEFCVTATEPDEQGIVLTIGDGTVLGIDVEYNRGTTANHDAFARLLAEKFGRPTKRDTVVVGEYETAEARDRTIFVRGGDRAIVSSYSMAANVARAPDKGAAFELLIHDVARAEQLRRRLVARDRARDAAKESAEAGRLKF